MCFQSWCINIKIIKTCLEKYQIIIREIRTEFISEIREFKEFKKFIKEKEWKQSLIIRNTKWNEIARIMKEMKEINMNIIKHQKWIMFNKIKMSEHKIMLKMNWL